MVNPQSCASRLWVLRSSINGLKALTAYGLLVARVPERPPTFGLS